MIKSVVIVLPRNTNFLPQDSKFVSLRILDIVKAVENRDLGIYFSALTETIEKLNAGFIEEFNFIDVRSRLLNSKGARDTLYLIACSTIFYELDFAEQYVCEFDLKISNFRHLPCDLSIRSGADLDYLLSNWKRLAPACVCKMNKVPISIKSHEKIVARRLIINLLSRFFSRLWRNNE